MTLEKKYGLKGVLWFSLCHTLASMSRFLFMCLFFVCFIVKFLFVLWERLQGQRVEVRVPVDEWDWDACCKIHTESLQSLKNRKIRKSLFFLSFLISSLRVSFFSPHQRGFCLQYTKAASI